MPGSAGRRSTRPSFNACRRNAGTLGNLSGERVAKELLRLLARAGAGRRAGGDGRGRRPRSLAAGIFRHGCLRGLVEREDKPDPLRRLAAILSPPRRRSPSG